MLDFIVNILVRIAEAPIEGYNMEEWFVPAKADIQSLRNEPST